MSPLAKVELLVIAIGAACGLDVLNSHYARGFNVCIFSAHTFAFVATVTYATPLTAFIHLTSPGLQQSSDFRHACRLHYVLASVAYLTVLVFLVTRQGGIAREAVRYRVVVMSMINMVVYCLLAFLV
ncbi:hypothetical protein HPB48_024382 [Haemaphysalis longicornis]|uniref:Uncharacterized protein n=1 Tax=Haemaphysalis longicornis TaxID=44386 RepID=A0A9J6H7Y4_HAELO|nr:hypothetical protein HPB48_024382 [Haemaphysalis longicornis]